MRRSVAKPYGQRTPAKRSPGSWPTDKRYQSRAWRDRTRPAVLKRDGYRCWVAGCWRVANVVDHIDPVTEATTYAAFHDVRRLRASCREHNLARAIAGHDAPELGMTPRQPEQDPEPLPTIRGDYTWRP